MKNAGTKMADRSEPSCDKVALAFGVMHRFGLPGVTSQRTFPSKAAPSAARPLDEERLSPRAWRTFLVIGWGNDLRSDDGAGRAVVRAVAKMGLPNVQTLDVHQLTPEVAERIKEVRAVVFVDACPIAECGGVYVQSFNARREDRWRPSSSVGHMGSPSDLLRLTRELYGVVPEAWLVAVPAESFAVGETLSAKTAAAVGQAVAAVEELIQKVGGLST